MTPAARLAAAIQVLDRILSGEPAERALTNWGRGSRFAGSGDRSAVRDLVFDALRQRRSAAALGGGLTGRGLVLGLARASGQEDLFTGEGHAPAPIGPNDQARNPSAAEAMDLPDWLLPELKHSLGDKLPAIAEAMRHRAPVFLRVNLRKTDRAGAITVLAADEIGAEPHPLSSTALRVTAGARKLQTSTAFRNGLVELQDAASQAVVDMLPLADGMRVLDLCAGGGGKTLAMGARADVLLFAHDIQPRRMADLPDRAQRAGIEVRLVDQPEVGGSYDLVLVDAPCSGSGSWRRDPEGKWALTPQRLAELCRTQVELLNRAAGLVAPEGWLAYATCSLLEAENGEAVAGFLRTHPDWAMHAERRMTPLEGGDGFYGSLLRRIG